MGDIHRRLRLIVGAMAIAVSMAAADACAQFLSFSVGQCRTDDEVAMDQRAPYDQAALRLVRLIVQQDAAEIHRQLAPDAQRAITPEQITGAVLQPLAKLTQKLGEPRVVHSFLLMSSGSVSGTTVMCTAHWSAADLGDKVFVAAKPVPKQAHVVVEADGATTVMTFVVWLVPGESGEWRIEGFHALPTVALGKTAVDFLAMAREQRDHGHPFNAAMLFAETANLGYRGKFFQLGFWHDFEKEREALDLPAELKGKPPFTWQFDDEAFNILNVRPLALDRELALIIQRETPSLADTNAVRDESRRLIASFLKKRPEVREIFDGVVIQALQPGSSEVFGTVEKLRGATSGR